MYGRTKNFNEYYSDLFEKIKEEIIKEKDDYIIATPIEDLSTYYYSKYSLSPIEFDFSKDETISHTKNIKTIPSHKREYGYQNEGDLKVESELLRVNIPLIPNNKLQIIADLNTQSFSLSHSNKFAIFNNNIFFEFEMKGYGINLTEDQIVNNIESTKTRIQEIVNQKNSEIVRENGSLTNKINRFISERKTKLDTDNDRLNSILSRIKIPLERKSQDLVKKIQIDTKPFVNRLKPKQPDEEYQLDRDKVLDIIKLIDNQCLQFEKTPETYSIFGEESLRDQILANLNSIFEGKATGETFNNEGKTDIYLNIDKGNILISECKFYGGEKLYHDTIDQILGYLTWRQNYGIMITFSKNSSFTKVIEDAEKIITSHESYLKGFKTQSKTHFISYHTIPTDEYKSVEIHHIYYNLNVKKLPITSA